MPVLLGNMSVRGHFFVAIYTVVSKKENPKKQNEKICFRNH